MGACYGLYQNQQLRNKDIDVPFFNFNGEEHYVKVVNVYDGDTCQVMMKFNNNYYKFKIRALGYDSPEMKTPKDATRRLKINKIKSEYLEHMSMSDSYYYSDLSEN